MHSFDVHQCTLGGKVSLLMHISFSFFQGKGHLYPVVHYLLVTQRAWVEYKKSTTKVFVDYEAEG